jgi:hypothetical protein
LPIAGDKNIYTAEEGCTNPALQGYGDVSISRGVTYEDLQHWGFLINCTRLANYDYTTEWVGETQQRAAAYHPASYSPTSLK